MSLIARSALAHAVAEHIVGRGTQCGYPPGVRSAAYRRALLRLEKAGVIRRWCWSVDGLPFEPTFSTAGNLWLAGPRWEEYVQEALELYDRKSDR